MTSALNIDGMPYATRGYAYLDAGSQMAWYGSMETITYQLSQQQVTHNEGRELAEAKLAEIGLEEGRLWFGSIGSIKMNVSSEIVRIS